MKKELQQKVQIEAEKEFPYIEPITATLKWHIDISRKHFAKGAEYAAIALQEEIDRLRSALLEIKETLPHNPKLAITLQIKEITENALNH